ncbi:3-oxoacyl-[acyl-carrier-protein] synthase-3 [Saccharicrinis carchari]|uniref:3-oxoacyl-[acyl-carrier-protein] synthase-3 n=1 Tax=Saccharicrinis carchari TaxID=1168039 RepID=A0A521BTP7_SACCC|nr:ketoacyl-ACP synthase III [Saccharicrinis carchari]SMO50554.1 3-oxoacyl-[acyl-carrier-protein] synthase-3 [Saccharicrinis carchari]
MGLFKFTNIGISGISAAVPKNVIDNYEYDVVFPKEELKEVVDKIGVKERRFADKDTCASDLCYAAAQNLLEDMKVSREEIDLLLFISQTPDYRMPATSIILQHKLGLSRSAIAFDISLGCSAFLYGLSVAYSMISSGAVRKALVLDGETRSKVYSAKDRKTAFLFGDAGVAALIEKDEKFGTSWFSLNSDGERESLIKIPAGGYRNMTSAETLKEKVVDEYGNMRSDEQGYMNGADVFNFVLREVPKDFKRLVEYAGVDISTVDHFVFHQANKYINGLVARKLKLPADKIPSTIEQYGNTSSVSIPLTIVSKLKNKLNQPTRLLLCGFGVGLSWGTTIINVEDCYVGDVLEV